MHRVFRRSLWFVPVVILPVGALLVMQYRFLRTLEQKSVSAERNWQRGAIEMVAQDIDDQLRRSAQAAVSLTHVQLLSTKTHGKHFRESQVPGARLYFATRFTEEGKIDTRFYDPKGGELHGWWHSDAEAVKMASMPWHSAHKWRRVAEPALQVDERDPRSRIIQRPVVDESWHVVGVAGVVLDPKLARTKIRAMATDLWKARYPKRAMNVRVGDDIPRRDYISHSLAFVFTNWRIGIRDACTSPEQLAAQQFRHNMMWTGGAFFVLFGAIGLAGGAVARQMRLSQMKSDFVSNVSHELRTPLSSIRVFGEYMRLGRVTKDEKIREYGEYIEAESRRLTALINNILDFSKIESAEKKYHFCATDIVELVEQTVEGFEMPLRDAGVSIAFAFEGTPPPLLLLDKDAIAQVLVNLLDNAVKYSNGNKNIGVTVLGGRDEVHVRVRDHGIGIAAAERKKIFEKFYRVGSGLVHDVKGSGLGLSIVQHVVQAHGGRVEVESEVGAGSTFTLVLPIRTATENVPMTQELA
ncbi:MAG TPA: HAMP domain-containing sensor histidine kinase [Thermoanaerobaculia bacterium]|nr:HAMP domain-containing sensor histidine kinase [Thermoanaerobaculia bacterium]